MAIDLILSLVMLATIVLVAGAIYLWRRGGHVKQVWLMLVLAAVMVFNILIWTIPDSGGMVPLDHAATN